jgi:transposase
MNNDKYVGVDVDQATLVIVIEDSRGKCSMEAFVPCSSRDIKGFFKTLKGTIHVAFEEGAQAAWLYDLIEPLVRRVVVCDPRRNKLIQSGNKGDRIDARKLAKLLRLGELHEVYHGERTTRGLKELVRAYECLVEDTARTKNRLKGAFRSRGIRCRGKNVYHQVERKEWLAKVDIEALGLRVRGLYEQLDYLSKLREESKRAMLAEAKKHLANKLVMRVSGLGPVRSAQIIATVGTPNRFRTKRQFWPYCGLGVVSEGSGEYEIVDNKPRRRKKSAHTRGLNRNFNRRLKAVFKGAATSAIVTEPFKQYYQRLIDNKMREEMALLTVARKIAAITLAVWKKGEKFDSDRVNQTAQGTGNE